MRQAEGNRLTGLVPGWHPTSPEHALALAIQDAARLGLPRPAPGVPCRGPVGHHVPRARDRGRAVRDSAPMLADLARRAHTPPEPPDPPASPVPPDTADPLSMRTCAWYGHSRARPGPGEHRRPRRRSPPPPRPRLPAPRDPPPRPRAAANRTARTVRSTPLGPFQVAIAPAGGIISGQSSDIHPGGAMRGSAAACGFERSSVRQWSGRRVQE